MILPVRLTHRAFRWIRFLSIASLVLLGLAFFSPGCQRPGTTSDNSPPPNLAIKLPAPKRTLTNGALGIIFCPESHRIETLLSAAGTKEGFRPGPDFPAIPNLEGTPRLESFSTDPSQGTMNLTLASNQTLIPVTVQIHRTEPVFLVRIQDSNPLTAFENQSKEWVSNPGTQAKEIADSWQNWVRKIEILGSPEDDEALAGLEARVRTGYAGNQSYGPFSGTNRRFTNHIFWDLDVWVFPALAFIEPTQAENIAAARLKMGKGMEQNARSFFDLKDRETGRGVQASGVTSPPLRVAWESLPNGIEASTAPTKFAEHHNAAVALMLAKAVRLDLVEQPDRAKEMIKGIADFFSARSFVDPAKANPESEILQVISPSEWHEVDNDLATNAGADLLRRLTGSNQEEVPPFALPRDEKTFLSFDNDPLRMYQQHAALLALWPYEHPKVKKEAPEMLDRFLGKTTLNGPAMSLSLEALLLARNGQPDNALVKWRESWQRYTDNPAETFIEKPGQSESYFYTGAAGCLNSVLYGFLGINLEGGDPGKPIAHKIAIGENDFIVFQPNLPKEWEGIKARITLKGTEYLVTVTHTSFKIQPSPVKIRG
ncbi:MAG: hypothetical protein MUC92_04770 [Fimbriimonadaceae bacterium]|jgi:hypothetical protein|nr:hypothetical protein [Fimbriimonadaceae bacterium]